MKKNSKTALKTAATAVTATCLCAAAVSFAVADAGSAPSKDDPYASNTACLTCHGGTQRALEELTDYLGDSNPHGGTHGSGGIACNVCHEDGAQVPTDEQNMCLDCHAWPRSEQSLLSYMGL